MTTKGHKRHKPKEDTQSEQESSIEDVDARGKSAKAKSLLYNPSKREEVKLASYFLIPSHVRK